VETLWKHGKCRFKRRGRVLKIYEMGVLKIYEMGGGKNQIRRRDMPEYEISREVEAVARPLIEANHRHLLTARITFLFRDRAWKTPENRTILGRAAKRNELDKVLSEREEDFIIIIAKPTWERMTDEEKSQVVDHELCHCSVLISNSGVRKWMLRKHPIEDFPENLARYEFRRRQLGDLIANPPSPIVSPAPRRRITVQENEEAHEDTLTDADTHVNH